MLWLSFKLALLEAIPIVCVVAMGIPVNRAPHSRGILDVMLKGFVLIFAIVFIGLGVVGFIPPLMYNQLLFNLFEVSSAHNLFYILTGLIALSASASAVYAKLYFKIFGIIFALIAILGFALNGNLGFLQVNLADSFFHAIIAIIALYLGFTSKVVASSHSH